MTHRKIDSFRRWKARFKLGKWIPIYAILQHPRLVQLVGSDDVDFDLNFEAARVATAKLSSLRERRLTGPAPKETLQ